MAAQPSQTAPGMLTTLQIQAQKLEENFDLLTKLTSINPAIKQDTKTEEMVKKWSDILHTNLMQLAGQADQNAANASAAATVPAAAAPPGAAAQ